jgi:hypothetical protein
MACAGRGGGTSDEHIRIAENADEGRDLRVLSTAISGERHAVPDAEVEGCGGLRVRGRPLGGSARFPLLAWELPEPWEIAESSH